MKKAFIFLVFSFLISFIKAYPQESNFNEPSVQSIFLKDTTIILQDGNYLISLNPNDNITHTLVILGKNLSLSTSGNGYLNGILLEDENIKVLSAINKNDSILIEILVSDKVIPGMKKGLIQLNNLNTVPFYFILFSEIIPKLVIEIDYKKIKLYTGESNDISKTIPIIGLNNIESFYFKNIDGSPNKDIILSINNSNTIEVYAKSIVDPNTKLYCKTKNIFDNNILLGNISSIFNITEKNLTFKEISFYKSKRKIEKLVFQKIPDNLTPGKKYYLKNELYTTPLEVYFKDSILFSIANYDFNIDGKSMWKLFDVNGDFLNVTGWIDILDFPQITSFNYKNTNVEISRLYGDQLFSSEIPMTYNFTLTLKNIYNSDEIVRNISFFGTKLPSNCNIILSVLESSTVFDFEFTMPKSLAPGINYLTFVSGSLIKSQLYNVEVFEFVKPMILIENKFIKFQYKSLTNGKTKVIDLNQNKRIEIDIDVDHFSEAKFILNKTGGPQHLLIGMTVSDFNGDQIYPKDVSKIIETEISIIDADKPIPLTTFFDADYKNYVGPNRVIKVIIKHDILKYNPILTEYPKELVIYFNVVNRENKEFFTHREVDINILPFQSYIFIFDNSDTTGNKLKASPFNIGFNMIWKIQKDFGYLDNSDDVKFGFGAYMNDLVKIFDTEDQKISFSFPALINWNIVNNKNGDIDFKIYLGFGPDFEYNISLDKFRTLPCFVLGFGIPISN